LFELLTVSLHKQDKEKRKKKYEGWASLANKQTFFWHCITSAIGETS